MNGRRIFLGALAAGVCLGSATRAATPDYLTAREITRADGEEQKALAAVAAAEFDRRRPAAATLADGRVLTVWLERSTAGNAAVLKARVAANGHALTGAATSDIAGIGGAGRAALPRRADDPAPGADRILDTNVFPASLPDIAVLLDGGALVAYRGLDRRGLGSPRLVRFRPEGWDPPHEIDAEPESLSTDDNSGPRIAADGGRVAAAWTSGSGGDRRITVSISPDAGTRFLLPVTASGDGPASAPAVALLHDGAILVAWMESSESSAGRLGPPSPTGGPSRPALPPSGGRKLWLRRLSPDLRPGPAVALADVEAGVETAPQIVLLRDYEGNDSPARALVAWADGAGSARPAVAPYPGLPYPGPRLFIATVNEGALLAAADDDCRCAPTPAQLAGYPIRGTITALSGQELTLDLDAAPGVLPSGPHRFSADPATLAAARAGRSCLARIERGPGGWRMFDLRLLEEAR